MAWLGCLITYMAMAIVSSFIYPFNNYCMGCPNILFYDVLHSLFIINLYLIFTLHQFGNKIIFHHKEGMKYKSSKSSK